MRKRVLSGVALTAGVLALASCGAGGGANAGASAPSHATGSGSASSSSRSPADSSSTSGSSTSGGQVNGAHLAEQVSAAMRAKDTGRYTLSVNGTALGHGTFQLGAHKSRAELQVQGRRLTVVQVGKTAYLKGMSQGSRPWVVVRPNGHSRMAKVWRELGVNRSDPTRSAEILRKATVVDKGTTRVNGKPAHEYKITVPVSAYSAVMSPKLTSKLKQVVDGPVRLDYFVGAVHLPVKFISTLKIQGQRQVTTVTFGGWGSTVHISAPPKSQVTDAGSLSQQPA